MYTTAHLVHDIEQLRCHLDIQHWLVLGGSWGSTLALAYAETHPECVTEMILFGVTTGQRNEFDWPFRGGLARLFPQEWDRLLSWLPRENRDGDIVEAYRPQQPGSRNPRTSRTRVVHVGIRHA